MSAVPAPVVERARSVGGLIRAHAPEGDAARRLPRPIVDGLAGAGLFQLWLPPRLGGPTDPPLDALLAVEEVSRADGSAGWCCMIGAESNGVLAGFLPPEVAAEMFADPTVVTAGTVAAGGGHAVAVDGGYRISGRWRFASGCQHAAWTYVNCDVREPDGSLRMRGADLPEMLLAAIPATELEVVDTWNVVGLRGTGSHDVATSERFVPNEHTFSLFDPPRDPSVPFVRLPFIAFLALTKAPVGTGIARGVIDEVVELAATKTGVGSSAPLREQPRVQLALAEATTRVEAARAFVASALADVLAVIDDGPLPHRERALLRLACANAVAGAAAAVDLCFTTAGSSAIVAGGPLERALRDVHTLTQHVNASAQVVGPAGRVLLGLKPEWPLF